VTSKGSQHKANGEKSLVGKRVGQLCKQELKTRSLQIRRGILAHYTKLLVISDRNYISS